MSSKSILNKQRKKIEKTVKKGDKWCQKVSKLLFWDYKIEKTEKKGAKQCQNG